MKCSESSPVGLGRAQGRAHQGPGREGYDITFKGGIPRLSDPYITLRAGGGWRSRL